MNNDSKNDMIHIHDSFQINEYVPICMNHVQSTFSSDPYESTVRLMPHNKGYRSDLSDM